MGIGTAGRVQCVLGSTAIQNPFPGRRAWHSDGRESGWEITATIFLVDLGFTVNPT